MPSSVTFDCQKFEVSKFSHHVNSCRINCHCLWKVKLCQYITIFKCLKGHNSLRSLHNRALTILRYTGQRRPKKTINSDNRSQIITFTFIFPNWNISLIGSCLICNVNVTLRAEMDTGSKLYLTHTKKVITNAAVAVPGSTAFILVQKRATFTPAALMHKSNKKPENNTLAVPLTVT